MPQRTKRGGLFGFRRAKKSDLDNRRNFERWRGYTINGHTYDDYDPTVYWPGRTNPGMKPKLNFNWKRPVQAEIPQPVTREPVIRDPILHANTVRSFTENRSSRKISTFIKHVPQYRASYLNRMCADSGVCFAFGQEKTQLMRFFSFNTFKYAVSPMKRIGDPSINGFITELMYTREGYNAFAILKSSLRVRADNLAYEYMVGQYINDHFALYLPGFIETYGLFKYPDIDTQTQFLANTISPNALTGMEIEPDNPDICTSSNLLCILIQHIKGAKSMYAMITNRMFLQYDAVYAFFQIYFTLDILKDKFTHYDLHGQNVLLYEPVVGGYIHYHYHTPSGTLSFKSKYMVKMIDYGRCFFPMAKDYYEKVCTMPMCNTCGSDNGFTFMSRDHATARTAYMNGVYNNQSHDLRLLNNCKALLRHMTHLLPPLKAIINAKYDSPHGTPELIGSNVVGSVSDVVQVLLPYMQQPDTIAENDSHYESLRKIGDLNVYSDLTTPMEFIPTPKGGKTRRLR